MRIFYYRLIEWTSVGLLVLLNGPMSNVCAQTSYANRLDQITSRKVNETLGTISGSTLKDKRDVRKRDLNEAYNYVPMQGQENKLQVDYVAFRKDHNIPNYMGDDTARKLLKTPDDEIKNEVVKVVETEKLLYETFQTFHGSKEKLDVEQVAKKAPEMDARINIIGKKSASILNASLDRLHLVDDHLPSSLRENQSVDYLASGGRIIPNLQLEHEEDMFNLQTHVIERVRRELLSVLSRAINDYYHRSEKETVASEAESKQKLLSFVKVEDNLKTEKTVVENTLHTNMNTPAVTEVVTTHVKAGQALTMKPGGASPGSSLSDAEMHNNVQKALELARNPKQWVPTTGEGGGSPPGSSLSDSEMRANVRKAIELANNPISGGSQTGASGSPPPAPISDAQMRDNVQRALDLANNPPQ